VEIAPGALDQRVLSLGERSTALMHRAMASLAGLEASASEVNPPDVRAYGVLLWRSSGVLLLLLALAVALGEWQDGSGRDSLIVAVLCGVAWAFYLVAQVAFVILVGVALRVRAHQKDRSA
jgi:hypothetical protein